MPLTVSFDKFAVPSSGALVVAALAEGALTPAAAKVDEMTGGALTRAAKANDFTGKKGTMVEVVAPAGLDVSRVVLVGLGDPAKLDLIEIEKLGGKIAGHLLKTRDKAAAIAFYGIDGLGPRPGQAAAHLALGACLKSYRFDRYRTREKDEEKPALASLTVLTNVAAGAKSAWSPLEAALEGVFFTRDLVSEPANVLYPAEFARRVKAFEKLGVKVEILGEKEMEKLGMGALLGVGQGSRRESQLVVMQWLGRKPRAAKGRGKKAAKAGPPENLLALVGKGVCFDTGGISIKPAQGMEDMKWDMGGAGIVAGTICALAKRKAKANVVGVIGLVENMPDGNAQRPGDVVTSMSGQTIEVINTDAEGRLVLADALWYTQDRFKPKAIIDLATLTGAILITFGHEYAGVFSNDDTLWEQISSAGAAVGEPVWRQPIGEYFDKMIKSPIADMKNVGQGRLAGSSAAAVFLQRFVNDLPWAHMDVAGVVWREEDRDLTPKGATGYGVRLLDHLVASHYEK